MAFHPQLPDFVRVQSVTARHRRLPGTEKLGKGEAEAILLAKEVGADILLTDDRKARTAAVSLNVRCTGLLGLLILAKQANHLESVTKWSKSSRSRAAFTCRPTSRSKPRSSQVSTRRNLSEETLPRKYQQTSNPCLTT
jgi:hypothetical protein